MSVLDPIDLSTDQKDTEQNMNFGGLPAMLVEDDDDDDDLSGRQKLPSFMS